MHILLWTYGCACALLGIIFLIVKPKKTTNESPWVTLILFIIAPITILCILYGLISNYVKERKRKILEREIEILKHKKEIYIQEKREREEKLCKRVSRDEAKKIYYTLVLRSRNLISPDCIELARSVHNEVKQGKYQEALEKLSNGIVPDGANIKIDFCKHEGIGSQSYLYLELPKGKVDYNIFDHLIINDLPINVWQAFLVDTLWHILPMWWHECYNHRLFIFNSQDFVEKSHYHNPISLAINNLDFVLIPQIFKDGNAYYVSYCYWNDWTGLVRECKKFVLDGNKIIEICTFYSELLYKYDCGIQF